MLPRRLLLAVISWPFIIGCAMPTTKTKYREMARDSSLVRIDHYLVPRPLKTVFQDIKTHSDRCLNASVRKGAMGRGGSFDIQGDSSMIDAHSAEAGMKINGAYYMVVDLKDKGRATTEVTAWGSKFNSDIYFQSYASWAKGEKPICPEF